MTKTLILKSRYPTAGSKSDWHDFYVLSNAINTICKGKEKNIMKLAPWLSVARKIQLAAEEVQLGDIMANGEDPPNIEVEIKNSEARLFWKELIDLDFEGFSPTAQCVRCGTGVATVPNVGTLVSMLMDVAEALGEKFPEGDEDEKDNPINAT